MKMGTQRAMGNAIYGLSLDTEIELNNRNYERVEGVWYPMYGLEQQSVISDPVNHPAHYTFGNIECIEALESMCTPEEFIAFLRLTIVQYIWRMGRKHSTSEDLDKAFFYIDLLKKKVENVGEGS
jgi:hypothetical protein